VEEDRPADAPFDVASPLADPATRLLARVIDALVPLAPSLVLAPIGAMTGSLALVRAGVFGSIAAWIALLGLNAWWLHRYGQTLGKRVVGVRIVRAHGERASFGRIFWRRIALVALIEAIPLVGFLFGIADPLLIFTPTRQTLHDRFAGTIVVDLHRGSAIDTAAALETFG
jgi:uncharacterized RDD family membrane protein YckC